LEHGTGALNIDGCRIETNGLTARPPLSTAKHEGWQRPWNDDDVARARVTQRRNVSHDKRDTIGRWPANVTLDDEAAGLLDHQSGHLHARGNVKDEKRQSSNGTWPTWGVGMTSAADASDSGGASRFFYTAKASRKDRNTNGANNTHPTVKPTKLMQWLITLVLPPGGILLDPFAGSGSTGVAARNLDVRCILIEREDEYVDIIRQRLDDQNLFVQD
jgi:hypothetical protein